VFARPSPIGPQGLSRARRWLAWTPVIFGCLGALAILLLWRETDQAARLRLGMETRVTATQIGLRLEAWIDARTKLMDFLANDRYADLAAVAGEFPRDAARLVELHPGLQALNFIDRDWVIRIVVPPESNAPALDRDLHGHPSRGVVEAVLRAERSGRITRTPVVDLLQGGRGFATYAPVKGADGQTLGFLNAVFRLRALVDTCLAEADLRERFAFCLVAENDTLAYSHPDAFDASSLPHAVSYPVRIVDQPWTLTVAPRPAYAALADTRADEFLAAGALLLVASIALLLHILVRRQAALRESRAKYQLLVEHQSDVVAKVDAAGRFLYVSPSYCELFGRSETELLGCEWLPLVHAGDRDATSEVMQSLVRPPHRTSFEQRALTKDGWRWLAWSVTAVLDRNARIDAIIGVGRDITRRKELEEQLRQSQKMQAIGQLAGGIAHDFNNILQVMRGHLEMLLQDLQPQGQVRRDLEAVQRSAIRATELTKQLLTFSRQQMLSPAIIDLDEVVVDVLPLLRRLLREAIELEHRPAGRRLLVRADRGQLEQVLMNLCVNARDAITDTGRITVVTGSRELTVEFCRDHAGLRPGPHVSLEVVDTGHGIPPAVKERIFEPFFTTKTVGAGTGLGLATVYGIVQPHGGAIEVASEVGQGSRFTVWLPAAAGEPAERKERVEPAAPGGNETILVAEDDPTVRELAVRLLGQAGYRVLTAGDGQDAVEQHAAAEQPIALTLLDMVMPRLGGREAARRIRERDPRARILFVSGYAPEEAGPAPDADHLMKPYDAATLLSRVRTILDRGA